MLPIVPWPTKCNWTLQFTDIAVPKCLVNGERVGSLEQRKCYIDHRISGLQQGTLLRVVACRPRYLPGQLILTSVKCHNSSCRSLRFKDLRYDGQTCWKTFRQKALPPENQNVLSSAVTHVAHTTQGTRLSEQNLLLIDIINVRRRRIKRSLSCTVGERP